MLGKKNADTKMNTLIGAGAELNGDFTLDGSARIDGKIGGNVTVTGNLILGAGSVVTGDVQASTVLIGGEVTGSISAPEKAELTASAKVLGDIATKVIVIDEHAVFQGKIDMNQTVPDKKGKARTAKAVRAGRKSAKAAIAEALKEVEDEAITELVSKIKELGYHVITDGEFRRATWHLDFMWGFDGIGHTPTKTGLPFHGEAAMVDDTYIVGKIGLTGEHPFVEHFRFVKALEDENTVAKQTIPSPAQFLAQFTMPFNRSCTEKHYSDEQELVNDIVAAYGKVINDLYAAGCRNLQLDDCTWGMFADKIGHTLYGTTREGIVEFQKAHKDINNKVIANAPKDMIINTHVCRGNYHSTYACSGAYDAVAPYLFANEKADAFYLEFDDERSGSFEPLRYVAQGKQVVLGLITTKSPVLENKDAIIARIHEAAKYIHGLQWSNLPVCLP